MQTPHFAATRMGRGLPRHGQRSLGCGSGSMSACFTMSLAAACAPSRSTLRESESGAPGRMALLFVAGLALTKRRSSRLALHPDCAPSQLRGT